MHLNNKLNNLTTLRAFLIITGEGPKGYITL